MLATLGPPPTGDQWAVEWKFDGQRATLIADRGEVLIFSRNGADITRTFPELTSVSQVVGARSVVLDGEIVALDTQGRPSFTRLQRRWPCRLRGHSCRREAPLRLCSPIRLAAILGRAAASAAG